jgi:hypothetical protein
VIITGIALMIVVGAGAWLIGYYQAWHASLRARMLIQEHMIAVAAPSLHDLREEKCATPQVDARLFDAVQLAFDDFDNQRQMYDHPEDLILHHPWWWLMLTQYPPEVRPIEGYYAFMDRAGITVKRGKPQAPE